MLDSQKLRYNTKGTPAVGGNIFPISTSTTTTSGEVILFIVLLTRPTSPRGVSPRLPSGHNATPGPFDLFLRLTLALFRRVSGLTLALLSVRPPFPLARGRGRRTERAFYISSGRLGAPSLLPYAGTALPSPSVVPERGNQLRQEAVQQ